MPSTTRTFVAIPLPPPAVARLKKLQDQLMPAFPAARWSPGEAFHLTLAFLGDVLDTDLNALCRKVAEASSPCSAFELTLESVGVFPDPKRPRVIWAGLTAPNMAPLHTLRQAIADACTAAGYRPDDRFTPHITLGRFRQDRRRPHPAPANAPAGDDPTARFRGWTGGTFRVSSVITYSSTLDPEGPVYTPLSTAHLSGKKNDASP